MKEMNNQRVLELAEELFRQKRERRREMAALPVETTFEILLKLQQLAYDVAKGAGRTPREPWKISS
jgi:hypothetical protein